MICVRRENDLCVRDEDLDAQTCIASVNEFAPSWYPTFTTRRRKGHYIRVRGPNSDDSRARPSPKSVNWNFMASMYFPVMSPR
jgi:hypothetical protein